MKIFEVAEFLNYSWSQVATGYWYRYHSNNPYSQHVLQEDTIEQVLLPDGRLYIQRLLVKKGTGLPKWAEPITPSHQTLIIEETIVDRKNKTAKSFTKNIHYNSIFLTEETCTYTPVSKRETQIDRHVLFESGIWGFSRPLVAFAYDKYKRLANRSLLGWNYTMEQLFPRPQMRKPTGIINPPPPEFYSSKKERVKELVLDKANQVKNKAGHVKSQVKDKAGQVKDKAASVKTKVKDKADHVTGQVKDKASNVKDKASNVKYQVKDKASELKTQVKDKAHHAKDQVKIVKDNLKHKTDEVKEQVKEGNELKDFKPSVSSS